MCSAVLCPSTETAEKEKTFLFLPGKEDVQSFIHECDKACLNVMSFSMGSRFSLEREMSVTSCWWHSEISVGTRRKGYGAVWNSSTALGNQAQKPTLYLKMHGLSIYEEIYDITRERKSTILLFALLSCLEMLALYQHGVKSLCSRGLTKVYGEKKWRHAGRKGVGKNKTT